MSNRFTARFGLDNNGNSIIGIGNSAGFNLSGAHTLTFTTTANTSVVLPASGTLVNTTGAGATGTWSISISGNANTVTNGVYTTGNQTISGTKTFTGELDLTNVSRWMVSSSDSAHQRADARDDATNFSRLHWYGVSDAGATSNFRHAWYDGSGYINVTAASGTVTFSGNLQAPTFIGNLNGNASTAIRLQTARTINGTSFDGTSDITTANWGTARTLTVGNTGKSVNGSGNVSWSLAEIGAAAASHTHPVSEIATVGGTASGTTFLRGDGVWAAPEVNIGTTVRTLNSTNNFFGDIVLFGTDGITITEEVKSNPSGATFTFRVGTLTAEQIPNLNASKVTSGVFAAAQIPTGISITGNAATATKLTTARSINGTNFDGSANITTANWGTARTLTVGNTGKSVNGSGNVSWSLSEIGAPSTTGVGASGTWGISVTGNAATVTNGVYTTGNQDINGIKTLKSGLRGADTRTIRSPAGAYMTGNGSVTGAIRIQLPEAVYINNTMIAMKVVIYNYVTHTSRIIHIGGYDHSGSGGTWHSCFATQENGETVGDINVRFGRSGSRSFIYIGETTNAWSYPQVYVSEFYGGWGGGTNSAWAEGWAIDLVTTFENVQHTLLARSSHTAETLRTARTIGMTGDVTWTSAAFNGSANVTGTATLANSGVTAGTYPKVTVDAKGRVTAGASLVAADIPNLDAAKITTGRFASERLPSAGDSGAIQYNRGIGGTSVGLNTIGTSGFYRIDNTPTDAPPGVSYGQLIVSRWSDTILQIVGDYQNTNLFFRGASGASASGIAAGVPWRRVITDFNVGSFAPSLTGVGASGTWGISVTGNAATATTLQTARTINGTSFNGSANITTANWGTGRTLTIGNTGKSVDGSGNVGWSLAEIGAEPRLFGMPAPTNINWNDLPTSYPFSGFAGIMTNTGTTNHPGSAGFGSIYHYPQHIFYNSVAAGSNVTQIAWPYRVDDDRIGIRSRFSGTWSTWREILTSISSLNASNLASGTVPTARLSGTYSISISGNASTATTLQTARTINGSSFNGSANITTANWGTARTLTIGSTGKSVDGSGNVSWSLAEIGALGNTGAQLISKAAHAPNADAYHLELNSPDSGSSQEVSLRMHQANRFYGQIRLRNEGFHFTQGNNGTYRDIYFGSAIGAGHVAASRIVAGYDSGIANSINTSDWFRTSGGGGILFSTYGGGINMVDATYVRVYGNKSFYVENTGVNSLHTAGGVNGLYLGVSNTTSTSGNGLSLYGGPVVGQPTYGIMFAGTAAFGTHGGVTGDWATYFTMNAGATTRGWIFKAGAGTAGNVASISGDGTARFNGIVTAADHIYSSDSRLKRDQKPILDAVAKLQQLTGKTYYRTDTQKCSAGVIAQDVQRILPEAVMQDENGYLAVSPGALIGLLVEAVKELSAEVKALKEGN